MSKLSPTLKALIDAPFARPGYAPAPRNIRSVYRKIADEAAAKNVGASPALAISTAATMTMNSPDSMMELYRLASEQQDLKEKVKTVEQMREVGLKCIGFNGIPRTINVLGQFRSSLPDEITSKLSNTPTREMDPEKIEPAKERGRALWDSIYRPFESKLLSKLALSHPDLPVHILNSYAVLFSDPPNVPRSADIGRVLTSLVGITCLRAQTGVGPQVTSHVFGLRKAFEDGTWEMGSEVDEGWRWLGGDEGNEWVLGSVDRIVEAIGKEGSNYAQYGKRESKL